jgi:hypothetical protein
MQRIPLFSRKGRFVGALADLFVSLLVHAGLLRPFTRDELIELRPHLTLLEAFVRVETFAREIYGPHVARVEIRGCDADDDCRGDVLLYGADGEEALPDFTLPYWQASFGGDAPEQIRAYLDDIDLARPASLHERIRSFLKEEASVDTYEEYRLPKMFGTHEWDLSRPPRLYHARVYVGGDRVPV